MHPAVRWRNPAETALPLFLLRPPRDDVALQVEDDHGSTPAGYYAGCRAACARRVAMIDYVAKRNSSLSHRTAGGVPSTRLRAGS